jgi:hypothetical protein
MPPPQPTPDPHSRWPSCDDPQPGVSIRPLRQADLAALLAHLDQHHGQDPADPLESGGPAPVLALRVRASVGRPGASAVAEYRRRRAGELAGWTGSLPWRAAIVLAAGAAAGLLAAQLLPRISALAGVTVAAGLAWLLRFRVSADTVAWRRSAAGERRTAHTPGAAGEQAPLRMACRRTADQRLTTRVGPTRTINTTTQPPAGSNRKDLT